MLSEQPDNLSHKNHQLSKLKNFEVIGTLVAIMAGVLGVAATATNFFSHAPRIYTFNLAEATINASKQISVLKDSVAELQKSQVENQALLNKLSGARPATVQIGKLSSQVDSLQNQIKLLEDAVGQSPEKALAVPLLKKDMDNLKNSYRRDLDSTQSEINRVYDQNKWFIGLMFTMAIGLLGLAVSNFLQLRKSQ
jgi:cell fate (sporulation/competence/biofilm development) regulator YmcA (YheA/YmcA/DUF963 family)